MIRKKGETHGQFCRRLEVELKGQIAANVLLREENISKDLINPRTEELYMKEAKAMFEGLALAEHFLRTKQPDIAKTIIQEVILKLGFNTVQMHQDECIVPGAYDGKK